MTSTSQERNVERRVVDSGNGNTKCSISIFSETRDYWYNKPSDGRSIG
jgi:hypothetical protein